MSLTSLRRNGPSQLQNKTVVQVSRFEGDGRLLDGRISKATGIVSFQVLQECDALDG